VLHNPGTFVKHNFEAFVWLLVLILLAFMAPDNSGPSLCVFHHLGIDSCPGCGLGHSISSALHGHFEESFRWHPLGIIAIVVLVLRIVNVFKSYYNYQKLKSELYDKNL
jgi:hypothetical protein